MALEWPRIYPRTLFRETHESYQVSQFGDHTDISHFYIHLYPIIDKLVNTYSINYVSCSKQYIHFLQHISNIHSRTFIEKAFQQNYNMLQYHSKEIKFWFEKLQLWQVKKRRGREALLPPTS